MRSNHGASAASETVFRPCASVQCPSVRGGVPWWWFSERFGAYRNRQAADLGLKPSPRDAAVTSSPPL